MIQRRIIFTWEVNLGSAVHQHGCSLGCGLRFLCFVRKGLCLFPFYSCILFWVNIKSGHMNRCLAALGFVIFLLWHIQVCLKVTTNNLCNPSPKLKGSWEYPWVPWGDFTVESRRPTESNRWSESSSVTPVTRGTESIYEIPGVFAYCRFSRAESGRHSSSVTSCFFVLFFQRQTHSYEWNERRLMSSGEFDLLILNLACKPDNLTQPNNTKRFFKRVFCFSDLKRTR